MPWIYHQSTGVLNYRHEHSSHPVGRGYSGAPGSMNKPTLEGVPFKGPIPRGNYHIGPMYHHHDKGPDVMNLTPVGHDAHKRDHFRIHGDNKHLNHSASEGCIILPKPIRLRLGHSLDKELHVVW